MKYKNIFNTNYKNLKKEGKKFLEKFYIKNTNKNIIMGVDLSNNSTGICILDEKTKDILFMDKIYITSFSNTEDLLRISIFVVGLQKIINTFKPYKAIIEQEIYVQNVMSHSHLSKLHGILLYILMRNNIKSYYIHPSSAKSYIKCKTKKDVFNFLVKLYNLKELNFAEHNDGVDALLMAYNCDNIKKLKEV